MYDSVEEAEQFLRDSYEKAGWKGLGSWNHSGCIPERYIIPKYKAIVADRAEVRAKKGRADDIGLSSPTLTTFSDEHTRKEAVD